MARSNVICFKGARKNTRQGSRNNFATASTSKFDTPDAIGTIRAEIGRAYADLSIRASERGLSIASVNADGYPISLMLLKGDTYYISLGLAEFEVHDRELALDFVILACSRGCRLRTTEVGRHIRDWRLEMELNDKWRCVHKGGFSGFASWRRATRGEYVNERPVPACARASRRRILDHLGMSHLNATEQSAAG